MTVDPIDGTTNLVRGLPFDALSIAVSAKPQLLLVHAALVADLSHGKQDVAQAGKGSYRDGKNMRLVVASLGEAVIGSDLNTVQSWKIVPQLTLLIEATVST